jgi:hypothetical protein
MHHLQVVAEVEEVMEKKTTTLKLSDWVKIIPLLVKHGAEPNASFSFQNERVIRHGLSAIDIVMHAFSSQYPIQAADIRRILIARGAKPSVAKRPVRRAKRHGFRAKPTGSHRKIGDLSNSPRLDNGDGKSDAAGERANDRTRLPASSADLPRPPKHSSKTNLDEFSERSRIGPTNPELEPLIPRWGLSEQLNKSQKIVHDETRIPRPTQSMFEQLFCCYRRRFKDWIVYVFGVLEFSSDDLG